MNLTWFVFGLFMIAAQTSGAADDLTPIDVALAPVPACNVVPIPEVFPVLKTIPWTVLTPDGEQISCFLHLKHEFPALSTRIPVLILCHGMGNTHRAGILRQLAKRVPQSTVTFDFRGMGTSSGVTTFSNYEEETTDLEAVVYALLKGDQWGGQFDIKGIIGHSKAGSVVALFAERWMSQALKSATPSSCLSSLSIVIVAGQFNMSAPCMHRFSDEQKRCLDENGFFIWYSYGGDEKDGGDNDYDDGDKYDPRRDYIVRREDIERRMKTDMSCVGRTARCYYDAFCERGVEPPLFVRFLTVHGDADKIVPVGNSKLYDENLAPWHTLEVVPGADHVFSRDEHIDLIAGRILQWIEQE